MCMGILLAYACTLRVYSACRYRRGHPALWNWNYGCLWAAVQVLGIKIRSSARATRAPCHWVTSPAPPIFKWNYRYLYIFHVVIILQISFKLLNLDTKNIKSKRWCSCTRLSFLGVSKIKLKRLHRSTNSGAIVRLCLQVFSPIRCSDIPYTFL